MRGFPKKFNTAQDLEHAFELVQSGELNPVQLSEAIEAIKRRAFLHVPIVEISSNRRTVTVRYCNEAIAGEAGNVTITAVKHEADPNDTGDMGGGFGLTVLTLKEALPADVTEIQIPAPAVLLLELGITPARFNALQGAVEPMAMKGAL